MTKGRIPLNPTQLRAKALVTRISIIATALLVFAGGTIIHSAPLSIAQWPNESSSNMIGNQTPTVSKFPGEESAPESEANQTITRPMVPESLEPLIEDNQTNATP